MAAQMQITKPRHPGGRPSDYSPEKALKICELLAEPMSLREICKLPGMPDRHTVIRWLLTREEFRAQYAQAREAQADALFEEVVEIADDGRNDWMARQDAGDRELYELNGEHVQRSRLRVDARKWAAGKLAPKKYGDKVLAEVSGVDGAPLAPAVSVVIGAVAAPEPQTLEAMPQRLEAPRGKRPRGRPRKNPA